ncbi:hypothetical protein [Kutzneria sp. 744]|uniref:hypothetical protein n=1 Tax=Kutzneria sp. (strain 744) TaxID=345341 RepID=UPI0003EEAB9C|nr:hypothetical protein [Kutzneria sp. 744]EWM18451.1 secreted protein [Kutzneria sp. 744]
MRAFARVLVTAAVVGTVAALSVGAGVAERQSAQDAGDTGLVEDYTYPGADAILANRGIKLISGDGHLVMVDCVNVTGLIEVHAFNAGDHSADPGHYCFQVLGSSGELKLELTDAYQVKGDNHTVQATISVNGQSSTVPVGKGTWTGIGVGTGGSDPATLLELKASA